jgi:DNA-binding NarL/FixJ family response regulator
MNHLNDESFISISIHSKHPLAVKYLSRILVSHRDLRVIDASGPTITSQPNGVAIMEVILLDGCSISWPDFNRAYQPHVRHVILLQPAHLKNVVEELRMLLLGISGIVYASASLEEELPKAIETVLKGKLWVSRYALTEYLKRTSLSSRRTPSSCARLTIREEQIISLLTKGIGNKKIGSFLGISERTVKFHISNILRKRQASNRRALLLSLYDNDIACVSEPRGPEKTQEDSFDDSQPVSA